MQRRKGQFVRTALADNESQEIMTSSSPTKLEFFVASQKISCLQNNVVGSKLVLHFTHSVLIYYLGKKLLWAKFLILTLKLTVTFYGFCANGTAERFVKIKKSL